MTKNIFKSFGITKKQLGHAAWCVVLFLTFFAALAQPTQAQSTPDFNVLLSLRDTYGWGAVFNWQGNDPCPEASSNWEGVMCDFTRQRVISLDLKCDTGESLSQIIPPIIANLDRLQTFRIRGCGLTGNLNVLRTMTEIRFINFNGNHLDGEIPNEFVTFPNLVSLELIDNELTGAIPRFRDDISFVVRLQHNRLTYVPPDWILFNRDLSGNAISNPVDSLNPYTPINNGRYNKLSNPNDGTQTVPPTNVQVQPVGNNAALVTWTPISYQGDGGYYEVLSNGISRGTTASSGGKTASSLLVSNLPTGTQNFTVRTFTPAHPGYIVTPCSSNTVYECTKDKNKNDLTSVPSASITADITGAPANNLTVNSLADTDDGTCNAANCTLREAINAANATAADEIITFSVSGTITLAGSELTITNNDLLTAANNGSLTINGPTTGDGITVSGGDGITNNNRVFFINGSPAGNIFVVAINNLTISNGRLTGDGSGGGISIGSNGSSTVTINNSTLSNNFAGGNGGGIYKASSGTLTINNSTISNNSAGSFGGGISNLSGTLTMNNSTVSNNSAGTLGGGIFNNSGLNLTNSIIANSTSGGDCAGGINTTFNYSLVEDGSCGVQNGVNNNKTGDPNLGPLADNGGPTFTHALLPGSIAIDAANPGNYLPFDQRGNIRPADGDMNGSFLPDMGSFEALAPTAAGATISGRVFNASGRGVPYANVLMTTADGQIRSVLTNNFGYYRFTDVEVGQTLVFNVYTRLYQYDTQVVNLDDSIGNLNFLPQGTNDRKDPKIQKR